MKIVFTGGGTGGHFYPLIAVAEALQEIVTERHLVAPKLYYFGPEAYDAEALFANNDVELYDLHADPTESNNLALDSRGNGALLMAMNARLNDRLDAEVGEDRPDILPIRDGRVHFTFESAAG